MSLLVAEGLTVQYGDYRALQDVSVSFGSGEFVSIVGPNGAGKTTFVNALTGQISPRAGTIRFKGKDIIGRGAVYLSKMGMCRSFQLVSIFSDLTVRETLSVAVTSRRGWGHHWLRALDADESMRSDVETVADLFKLAGRLSTRAGGLSQGEKKLLDVASAFAMRPEVILLDEPTSGVSTADKHVVMKVLVEAAKQMGVKTIIQVEHDMDLVFAYSDRIVAMHEGRVIADASPSDFRADAAAVARVIGRSLN